MTEEEFANSLAALLSKGARAGRGNPDRMAAMVERVAAGLGFTIALAAEGDPATIDTMMAGAEAYAHQEAVDKAPFGELAALMSRTERK